MPKFRVEVPIEGIATYLIKAPSADEALAMVKDGEGDESVEWDWDYYATQDDELIGVREVK